MSSVTIVTSAERCDLAHDRPLARIAIAAATEHQNETSAHKWPQRADRFLERIWLVRVVDEDSRASEVADALQTPRRSLQRLQRLEHCVGFAARRDAEAGGDERVRDLEVAGERQEESVTPKALPPN